MKLQTTLRKNPSIWIGSAVSIPALFAIAQAGEALTLNQYLDQVETSSPAFSSARESEEAARLKENEADLVTGPQFFATTQWGKDARQGLFFRYDSVANDSYEVGFQQQYSFGLSAKLSYSMNRFEYQGLPDALLLTNTVLAAPFFEGAPKIEVSQSLWKNAFGSETKALEKQIRSANEAQALGEALKQKMTRVEAEGAYWRLALSREALKVAEETLIRARKLSEWSGKRAALGLGDRSDALQGQAAVRLRELQLQSAQDDERAARQGFNTSRGRSGSEVNETLDKLEAASPAPQLEGFETFVGASGEKIPVREDIQASEELLHVSEATSEIGKARNTPTLELVASGSLFSREDNMGAALSSSFGTDQPQYGAGIRFVLPLDYGSWSGAREGYQRDISAAEKNLLRRRLEVEQEWLDLKHRLSESMSRLKVARELESTQKEKSDFERDRLARGRSTTYQALMFEEDYAQARLTRLRHQFESLTIAIRMKSFQPLAQKAKTE